MGSEPTIHRYEVPVDGQWHRIKTTGQFLHVAARRADAVEVWAEVNVGAPMPWELRVFGTGHPLAAERGAHLGSTLAAGGVLVWHLYGRLVTEGAPDGV